MVPPDIVRVLFSGYLLLMSRQSSLSDKDRDVKEVESVHIYSGIYLTANDNRDNEMKPGTVHIYSVIYLTANDNRDNGVKPGTVHISSGIYLMAEENLSYEIVYEGCTTSYCLK